MNRPGWRGVGLGAVVFATAFSLSAPISAHAAADPPSEDTPGEVTRVEQEMVIESFDADVAAANGFQIVTNADGSQSSVPITPEAQQVLDDAGVEPSTIPAPSAGGEIGARGRVYGKCGSSWIEAEKGTQDYLVLATGYDVAIKVVNRAWTVRGYGFISGWEHSWFNSSNAIWDDRWGGTAIGPGTAEVTNGSNVVRYDGSTCYSLRPTDPFP